nr:MAG TPA: hypothetical protein [Caudoviricetes sp.]
MKYSKYSSSSNLKSNNSINLISYLFSYIGTLYVPVL